MNFSLESGTRPPAAERQKSPEKLAKSQEQEQRFAPAPAETKAVSAQEKLASAVQGLQEVLRLDDLKTAAIQEMAAHEPVARDTQKATDKVTDADIDEDLAALRPTFLGRLGQSRIARMLFGAVSLLGVAQSAEKLRSQYELAGEQAATQEQIVDLAYSSSLELPGLTPDHEPEPNATLELPDGTQTNREQYLADLNTQVTHTIKESLGNSFDGFTEGVAETTLPDGTRGVDALRLYAAYGDQQHIGEGLSEQLQLGTGMSENTLEAYGEVIRDSVLEAAKGGMGRIVAREFYGTGDLNTIDAGDTSKLHAERLAQTEALTQEVLTAIDFDTLPETTQDKVVENLTTAIRTTLDTDNAWTMAASSTGHWGEEAVRHSFVNGGVDTLHDNKPIVSRLEQILTTDAKSHEAWNNLASLETNPDGPLHQIADSINDNLTHKGQEFFSKALTLDPEAGGFKTGLDYFNAQPAAEPRPVAVNE